jgi:hypothetical protein
MQYDPHTKQQLRFERKDPTGRWSPIHDGYISPSWLMLLGGAVMGVVFAFLLWLAI